MGTGTVSWDFFVVFFFFKGSISRILRWVLLFIDRKAFSRPILASHKILSLLKGQFTNYKKQAGAPLYSDIVLSRQYCNRGKCGITQYWYAQQPLWVSWYYGKVLIHLLLVFLLVLWVHIAQMKEFPHTIWQISTISVMSSHSEEPVANFNIGNLYKNDLNL